MSLQTIMRREMERSLRQTLAEDQFEKSASKACCAGTIRVKA
jgi:hypothetical protein